MAIEFPPAAVALLPKAIELTACAFAFGPMATESDPVAPELSLFPATLEFTAKYCIGLIGLATANN